MRSKKKPPRKSRGLIQKLDQDDVFFMASGLAFDFLICFIPLILVILSVLGFFLHSSQEILNYVRTTWSACFPRPRLN